MSDLTLGLSGLGNFISNTVNTAVNSSLSLANDTVAQINSSLLNGTATINVGYMGFLSVSTPVGPDVTFDLPSNMGSRLALLDPASFQGTIDFYVPGGAPGGSPSQVQLTGVPADSWSLTNNVLTLYAGGRPTDALKVIPDPVGFGVYATPNGAVISSSAVATVPPSVVPLPGTVGM